MKLPIPSIDGDIDLIRDWGNVISKLKNERTNNLLMIDRRNVIGTIVCKPKQDKLLEATASQHHTDGKLHCYKMTDIGTSKTFFDAYIEQDRLKRILG